MCQLYWNKQKTGVDGLRDLWENIKRNVCFMVVPEGEDSLFEEVMTKTFPNPERKTDIQIQEAQSCQRR